MLHALEIEALKDIVRSAGGDPSKAEASVIDLRLSFDQNKKVVKEWLKAEGKAADMRSEMIAEKELSAKMTDALQKELEQKEQQKYRAVSSRKKDIDSKIALSRQAIMDEIARYNPYLENVTYCTLFSCMNGKHGKQKTNTINMGKHGIGKSRSTSDLLQKLEITDAVVIRGFMTPKKVYDTLKQNFCNIVCFDEAENIMNDEMSMFILRPAMFGGSVSWISARGDTTDSFEFTGTVIANMNHFAVTEAAAAPLFDRTLFNNTNLTNAQIIEKIQSAKGYQMNDEIWRVVKDKITLIRNEGLEELTSAEEQYVMEYVVAVASKATVFNKSLSARARGRALLVAKCMKSMFLCLDDKVKELFERLAKPYISTDDADDICVAILAQKPDLTRKQLTEIISEQKQISERQASRMVSAAIERGALTAINRSKLVINTGKGGVST